MIWINFDILRTSLCRDRTLRRQGWSNMYSSEAFLNQRRGWGIWGRQSMASLEQVKCSRLKGNSLLRGWESRNPISKVKLLSLKIQAKFSKIKFSIIKCLELKILYKEAASLQKLLQIFRVNLKGKRIAWPARSTNKLTKWSKMSPWKWWSVADQWTTKKYKKIIKTYLDFRQIMGPFC